ncbi:beta-mannosidase isoform X1 [Trichogramma pretiosum]|uniref:beta-mannosidase isoform X1 n=1 Tax=Trichogramma pretiosum TaxID=7493 RepID=UPI0006C9446B|nr:beta-mannosidase isoform X1 [Trichogramma pretiosum]XP_014232218.1 beta-mannosidase isoform X1 [Trichogramma pretiosum]XP_014232219.1 beta-mannosidase isoform X1 [Trichogramma pretiosum]XP_023315257.1 beta-mannosidase isoform X1 [Trichogramma pretiosum]
MIWQKKILLCVIIWAAKCSSISLNGKWNGRLEPTGMPFIAEIPGGIYTDLETNGYIKNNLMGFNDLINRVVANETVVYKTNFEVDRVLLKAKKVILIFNGLDTFGTIYVNNEVIGKASNMFLEYKYDIKNVLKSGNNELKVILESSVLTAKKLFDAQSLDYVVYPKCVPEVYNGECHVNHIRKMQASFGWDWGPAFPSMGIWKSVDLEPVELALISRVTADVSKINDSWKIDVLIFLESFESTELVDKSINVECAIKELNLNYRSDVKVTTSDNITSASYSINVPLNEIELWWPNGYGKQKLYTLSLKIDIENVITEKELKLGFRTVELVQEPLKKGLSFYFKVNGIPIFAKGSNWIPSSIFPEKLEDKKTLTDLLKASKDTHMNMMRVWGGGVYESDLFYDLADEYGIMIWQDFMFACNMYPSTEEFLENVKNEVVQNMLRLKHHPSIVIWAGNNENEAALYGNWYGTAGQRVYSEDYVKLYVDTIKKWAVKIDRTRPFVVSSPSNGLYSEQMNYTNSNPYSNLYGDVHYYNYLKNSWDINQYPITRFASEYGFQALPSIWTLMSAIEKSTDLELGSEFMKHRQHLPAGNSIFKILISKNFLIPNTNDSLLDLINFIYLTQVNQAVSMRIETESYRQMKSHFNDLDEGMTMGALYWQLNDVWQAPSWSSIDFLGRWKMLHYYVKDFFAPVIITTRLDKADTLSIYIVSDLLTPLSNITIEILIYDWRVAKLIQTKKITGINMAPNESKLVTQYWIVTFLQAAGCGSEDEAKLNCMIELLLKDADDSLIAPANYVYPAPLKDISLPQDSVEVRVLPENVFNKAQKEFEIEVTSQKLALFVWLELKSVNGRFSENGFHILMGKKQITFYAAEPTFAKNISDDLMVTTLSRIYNPSLRSFDLQIIVDEIIKLNNI